MMGNKYSNAIVFLLNFSRSVKTITLMGVDYFLLTFSFWSSLSIRSNSLFVPSQETLILILAAPLIAIPIFYFFGLYFSLTRYTGYQAIRSIIQGISIYTFLWFILILSVGIIEKPYDFLIINWLLTICLIGGSRIFIRWLLSQREIRSKRILIYGAGSAGLQIKSAIEFNSALKVIGFIDDDTKLHGLSIEDLKVFPTKNLGQLIHEQKIDQVLLAIPSLGRAEKHKLLKSLNKFPIEIRTMPGIDDIAEGKISISDLKEIKITELLGRPPREPDPDLISKDVTGKSILVIGAGGSIGSQLSKEILFNNPKCLILMDISEYSLYKLEREILEIDKSNIAITIVGNITDELFIKKVLGKYEVDTVFNAAAYKHVPMVEKNILPAIEVNINGTLSAIRASIETSVKSFVFISTDKAVRPTNIMGSTKRFAEMILQSYASEIIDQNQPRISIVRFGNVLGSSGSVVPLFEQQIKNGGPLTVTDPNIIRYFMTMQEASQLVIQSGAMEGSGDIYVLDMGEQVKIKDLAEKMVRLSGMTIISEENPDGDIKIEYTGLRPGEKLYEELFIGDEVNKTKHPKIMKTTEDFVSHDQLLKDLDEINRAMRTFDSKTIIDILSKRIDGFSHDKNIIDNVLDIK